MGLAFGLSTLLARTLGPSSYGVYTIVIAAVAVLGIPSQLGIPTLVLRETAAGKASRDWGTVKTIWLWGRRTTLVTSVSLAMLGAAYALWGPSGHEHRASYALGLALIPLIAMTNLNGAIVQGLGHVVRGQTPDLLIRPAVAILIVGSVAVTAAQSPLSPLTAVTAAVAASGVALAVSLFLYRQARRAEQSDEAAPQETAPTNAWLRAAAPLALVSGMQVVNQQVSPLLLGFLASDHDAGVYRAVTQLSTLLIIAQTATATGLAPRIAALYRTGAKDELQRLVTMVARLNLAIAAPACLIFMFAGGLMLSLVFGQDYASGATPLAILAIGQFFNAACGIVVVLLSMTGNAKHSALGIGVAAVVNLILHLALIPPFGMTGAAIASTVSLLVWNGLLVFYVHRMTGIRSTAFWWRSRS